MSPPPTIRIYTLPKAGTHFIKGVLQALEAPHAVNHCVGRGGCYVDTTRRGIIVIRDPRAFFVSLMNWSDRRCREGLEKRVTFPAFSRLELFEPWLAMSASRKLRLLMTLSNEAAYEVRFIRENFEFITAHMDLPTLKVIRFEDLIGVRGGGSEAAQLSAMESILGFFGHSLPRDEIRKATAAAWGDSETFHRGKVEAWREHFDAEIQAVFDERWSPYLDRWGYRAVDRAVAKADRDDVIVRTGP